MSKSTLSDWLHEFPLSEERIRALQQQGWKRSEAAIERFRNTMRRKKEKRLKEIYETQKKTILPLNNHEFFLAGLFLYWGEGTKHKMDRLSVSNTDPAIIKFFIRWLRKALGISKKKIRILLHLYSDMNIKSEIEFWSKKLAFPLSQFSRPYIKKTSSKNINHKGSFGHGTCNVVVCSVPLSEKILMGLKAIADYYAHVAQR